MRVLSTLNHAGQCTVDVWNHTNLATGPSVIMGDGIKDNYSIVQGDNLVGIIPTPYHVEIRNLLKGGFPFICTLTEDGKLHLFIEDFEHD